MSDRSERARARANLPGRLVNRDEDRPPTAGTAVERLELLAEASARAWALTGLPTPVWRREEIPGRVTRPA